ncbi:MAG: glycoside hydrolase family 5 protein [Alsobacter sp.]
MKPAAAPARVDRRTLLGGLAAATLVSPALAQHKGRPAAMPRLGGGINLAGAEFNTTGRRVNVDYVYPDRATVNYFTDRGFLLIRVPFLAGRLVAQGKSGLEPTPDMDIMAQVVKWAAEKNARVILDMHEYGHALNGGLIGRDNGAAESFAASWAAIARRFRATPNVIFGLMNEPNKQSAEEWLVGVNQAIAAIRGVGARQLILVAGAYWDGAHSWTSTPNGMVMLGVKDPGANFAYEVHQYLDKDSSGTHPEAVPGAGSTRLASFIEWCRTQKARAVLGEFGWADNPVAQAEGRALLEAVKASPDVWLGWTYWAAGPWWGDYMYSVHPKDGKDRPQMAVLQDYVKF